MRQHTMFDENLSNSPENVKAIVETKFNLIDQKMPDLLAEFVELLGAEKEKWGGVAAMKACMEEFFSLKTEDPNQNDRNPTVKDLEEFLFSPDRYVQLVIQRPDCPTTSKAVIQGGVEPLTISKTVKQLQGRDTPSTSKAPISNVVGPHVNDKTLKVKIYMGSGWNKKDFPKLSSPPSLNVKLKIDGGESYETKVKPKTAIPCWGEEFVFPLSRPRDVNLIVEVYDRSFLMKNEFAGKIGQLVSEGKQGIHTIFLSNQVGNPCSSWLVVRLMFD